MKKLKYAFAGVVLAASVFAWHGCALDTKEGPDPSNLLDAAPPPGKADPSDTVAAATLTDWQKLVVDKNAKRQQGFLSFEAPLLVASYVILRSQLRPVTESKDTVEVVSYTLAQREIELLSEVDISVKGSLFDSEELGKRSIVLKKDLGRQFDAGKDKILVSYPAFVGYVCDDREWSQRGNESPDGGHIIDGCTSWCTPYPGSPPASLSLLNLERLAPFPSSSIGSHPISILAHRDELSVTFDVTPGWEILETYSLAYLAFWRVGAFVGISTSSRVARPMIVTKGASLYLGKFELTCTSVSERAVSFSVKVRRG